MVNALLGQRYLAEGILPTTNEINVLKHADPDAAGAGGAQDGDGVFTRYLPAQLLKARRAGLSRAARLGWGRGWAVGSGARLRARARGLTSRSASAAGPPGAVRCGSHPATLRPLLLA